MRLGLLIGALVGGAIATLLVDEQRHGDELDAAPEREPASVIEKIRQRVHEAMNAGREAAHDKEAEMQREFDDARRGS